MFVWIVKIMMEVFENILFYDLFGWVVYEKRLSNMVDGCKLFVLFLIGLFVLFVSIKFFF